MTRFPVRNERGGSPAVEALLIVSSIVLLLSLATAGYRIAMAESAVDGVASAASRAASIARTAGQARSDAHQVANANLATAGLDVHLNIGRRRHLRLLRPRRPTSVGRGVGHLPDTAAGPPGPRPGRIPNVSQRGQSPPLDTYRERR